jgi:hypothetical protein
MTKDKLYELTDSEVAEALQKFEWRECVNTGVSKISGGFACAEVNDHDEDYFYFELKWGVQSDCENSVNTENWKMCRSTLRIMEA